MISLKKNIYYSIPLFFLSLASLHAQTGIGVSAGGQYPGISSSVEQDLQFKLGYGYAVFLRHAVIGISESIKLHARYSADFYFNPIDFPSENNVQYEFSDFSAGLFFVFNHKATYKFYSGLSINYMTSKAETRYYSPFNSQEIIPKVFTGTEYQIGEYYSLYAELFFQYGEITAGPEQLPITGFGLMIGATMFFSTE